MSYLSKSKDGAKIKIPTKIGIRVQFIGLGDQRIEQRLEQRTEQRIEPKQKKPKFRSFDLNVSPPNLFGEFRFVVI